MPVLTRRAALLGLTGAATLADASRALGAGHGRMGSFTGASGHVASGRVEVAGGEIVLMDDFAFDGAPDPRVAMGRGGYDPATLSGPLRADSGRQSYALPEGLDAGGYDEVWIWREEFDVPLAVARLR